LFTGEKSRLYSKLVEFGRIGKFHSERKWREMERKVIQSHYGRVCKEPLCIYRLYNPVTKHIVVNRDVTWLIGTD
jgi:hypothetical protein